MTTAGSRIKRVLLFGANGQLGWELQRHRPEAVELRALSRAQADIAIREQVEQAAESFQPDLIINAAAYTAVDLAESESEKAYVINRDGAAHCAEAALNILPGSFMFPRILYLMGVRRLLISQTVSVIHLAYMVPAKLPAR